MRTALLPALLPALLLLAVPAVASAPRALFDNTHAETAGNADWVIDDNQPIPVPDQSIVLNQPNPRTAWTGAISSWGVDLVRRGYTVATLTSAYGITYGNAANPYDLSNYDVFIVDEPNTRFTAAESTAIFQYVASGGGLVAVSDHWQSDRNNDHFDSTQIWDQLDAHHVFFGAHFDTAGDANNNITQTTGNVDLAPDDSIIHGPNGVADSLAFHNGTTLTLDPAANPSVRGNVWMIGAAHGNTSVMAAQAVYGNGRMFFTCDSSPADDGSAEPGNSSIFDGWGEASGRDSLLFQNATQWVTRRATVDMQPPTVTVLSPNGGELWSGGTTQSVTWSASDDVGVDSVDVDVSLEGADGPWLALAHGLANTGATSVTAPDSTTSTAFVRITARDHAGNAGSDTSDAAFTIAGSVGVGAPAAPALALRAPAPNPSRGAVRLVFATPAPGRVALDVIDPAGRRVWRWSGTTGAGAHELHWPPADARAGVYLVRLVTPWGVRETRLARLP